MYAWYVVRNISFTYTRTCLQRVKQAPMTFACSRNTLRAHTCTRAHAYTFPFRWETTQVSRALESSRDQSRKYVHTCLYNHTRIHICTHVDTHACMYVYMYVYLLDDADHSLRNGTLATHTYTHTHTHKRMHMTGDTYHPQQYIRIHKYKAYCF